jgi:hypothetical protein
MSETIKSPHTLITWSQLKLGDVVYRDIASRKEEDRVYYLVTDAHKINDDPYTSKRLMRLDTFEVLPLAMWESCRFHKTSATLRINLQG